VPSLYPDDGGGAQAETAWARLGEILGEVGGGVDDISDSESVGSIGFLGFGDGDASEAGSEDDGRPDWAQMRCVAPGSSLSGQGGDVAPGSPETIDALEEERAMQEMGQALGSPRSPRPRRASSGPKSPALRPVLVNEYDRADDEEAVEFEAEEKGPAPSAEHVGPPVDEVEAVFGR
jgi:hypothetical protein